MKKLGGYTTKKDHPNPHYFSKWQLTFNTYYLT